MSMEGALQALYYLPGILKTSPDCAGRRFIKSEQSLTCSFDISMRWQEVPLTVLQAVAEQLSVTDANSARLACSSWADAMPLPRVCINMSCYSSDSNQQVQQQQLLHSLQQPGSCSRTARHCVIKLPADGTWTLDPSPLIQQQQGCLCRTAHGLVFSDLAILMSNMPFLVNVDIRTSTNATAAANSQDTSPAAAVDFLAALASSSISSRLKSLGLGLSPWPAPQELSPILMQLPNLHTLQLHRCPVAVMCSLPPLPHLCKLSISGVLTEPVPRSYSYRQQGPLLPLLPGLQMLVLTSLPLDLRLQELEDIQEQKWMDARIVQQQGSQLQAAGSDHRTGRREQYSSVQIGQWVGTSITKQCPKLQHLRTYMQFGPAVAPLSLSSSSLLNTADGRRYYLEYYRRSHPLTEGAGNCCSVHT